MFPLELPEYLASLPGRFVAVAAAAALIFAALRGPPPGASPQLLPDVYLPSTSWDERKAGRDEAYRRAGV